MDNQNNKDDLTKNAKVIITNQPIEVKFVSNNKRTEFPVSAMLFYLAGFSSIGFAFYKLLAYENSESINIDPVNVYVGGDAYNYIINSNYFVGFNVLGLTLIIIASSIIITTILKNK